ncbi:MAG TPA: 30S ribosomal protein S2, partial [Gaiella sp.]|nr:30S ribosomal protein S2 [Gaiella sp.]
DPDEVTYVVPGNDDAIRSCSLVIRAIADGIEAGRTKVTEAEIAAPPKRDEPAEPAEPAEAVAAPESDGGQPGDEAATSADDAPVAVENGAQA